MITIQNQNIFSGLLLAFSISSTVVWANPSLEEIQRQFNAETISRPFSVPDDATLTEQLKAATERGKPTRSHGYNPGCFGLGCVFGYGAGYGYGYGSYFRGYARPYYGGYYGGAYVPYYYGW